MAEWCWIGMGLFCLAVGAAVALLALFIWFMAWLIRSGRRAASGAAPPPPPHQDESSGPVESEMLPAPPSIVEPVQETVAEPIAPVPLDGPFITYENRRAGHITIHRRGCWAIEKKGGGHRHGAGLYVGHASYEAAKLCADGTGLSVRECGICKPGSPTQPT